MGDDITIGVTEIVNNIEVTAQPNDQIVDISVIDNADDVTLNITPTVIEINVNRGSSFAKWGTILGTLSDQTDLQNALDLKANLVGGKVPASELPSYVDDVVEVTDYAALPTTGETGKIYVTLDNNKIYRWSGSIYIEIAANNAIWGAITGTLSNQTDLQSALDLKQNALTNPITGTGTTNKLPKFTGSTTISDSNITDNGTIVSISTNATINNINIGVGSGSATGFSTTVGASALVSNTTGLGNTAIGHSTLLFNTTGNYNTANGMFALKANISGNDNTSIGFNTLLSNTTGSNNTAIGSNAILAFTTGSNNTAIGYGAGGNAISSSSNNVYLGNRAGSNSFVTENNKLYIANAAGTPLIGGDFSAKTIAIDGTITATSIIKSGGTSSQFLKADGSVDSSTYALDNAVVHLTGAETITGEKSFNNATSSSSIFVTNSSTGNGISSFNTSTGNALYLNNNSTGKGAYINNISSGIGLFVNNTTAATGLPFVIAKSNSNVFTINDAGEATGTKFVKSGGTSSQFLKADGSVDSSTYALDNAVVHLAGSETISGTKTFNVSTATDAILVNNTGGRGLRVLNESGSLFGLIINNSASATATPFAIQKSGTTVFSISDVGLASASNGTLIGGTGTTNYIPKFTGSTAIGNSLIYDNGTNVGIGTTSPAHKLEVNGNGLFGVAKIGTWSLGGGAFARFGHTSYDGGSNFGFLQSSDGNNYINGETNYISATSTNIFETAATERMRITSGGNNQYTGDPFIYSNTTSGGTTIQAGLRLNSTDKSVKFFTNDLGRMDITSDGNVGIGVVPNAWGSIFRTQQMGNAGAFIAARTDGYNQIHIGANSYYNGTNWIYTNNGYSQRYYQADGEHIFQTAPSGTGGNAITFSEAMRITSGGNVGIGTTSPAEKLHTLVGNNEGLRVESSNSGFIELGKTSGSRWRFQNDYNVGDAFELLYGASGAAPTTSRLIVTSGGNVLVGTTTSYSGKFNVAGGMYSIDNVVGAYSTTNSTAYGFFNTGVGNMLLTNAGIANVGTYDMSTGIYTPISDINKKKDFEESTIGLKEILQLKPTLYRMKSDDTEGKKELGFIAQEVKDIIPQAYVESGEFIGLNFNAIVAALVKSVQELKAEIEILKNK